MARNSRRPGGLALATVISVLPVLIVFLFSQRHLLAGMTAGGAGE